MTFNCVNSSNAWAKWAIFPFICVFFIFFYQCLIVFRSFTSRSSRWGRKDREIEKEAYMYMYIYIYPIFPGHSMCKESACNERAAGGCVWFLVWKMPSRRGMASHSSILAWGNTMDRGFWQGYSSRGCEESDITGVKLTLHIHLSAYLPMYLSV